ncbi:MAG: tyrosine--tRNA ligase [Ureaplasma sp.]|nr:tyrosine--tRNA ligase [Ureaplasma sp.]MDE7221831.1 tyrosine--tRNA ligase [Ureaplasma sp.]
MNWFDDLKWRNLINSITNEEKLNYFDKNKKSLYVGFDPSASSLHLGNYVMILLLRRFKIAGFKPIAIIGGATGMIGDPSGKSKERNLLDKKTLEQNKLLIKKQLEKYAFCELIIDNYEFYKDLSFLDFLRDIGKLVNVNDILQKEIVKTRLETGISYTEFSYNLMQAYDFSKLYKEYETWLQLGGSDQWGNITSGIEMIRKMYGDDNHAFGMTFNLLTTSDGKKFGKSENNAIYLDKNLTSPYQMYQYLINQSDSDVIKLLKCLTMLTKEEIENIEAEQIKNPSLRYAQNALADWILTDIHGIDELNKAKDISKKLFSNEISSIDINDLKNALENVPTTFLVNEQYNIVDLLIALQIAKSKTQARELLSTNAIMVNGNKVNLESFVINKSDCINKEFVVVKKGKRNYFVGKWN